MWGSVGRYFDDMAFINDDVRGVAATVDPVHLELASLVCFENPMLSDIDVLCSSTIDTPPFDDLNAHR